MKAKCKKKYTSKVTNTFNPHLYQDFDEGVLYEYVDNNWQQGLIFVIKPNTFPICSYYSDMNVNDFNEHFNTNWIVDEREEKINSLLDE